LVGGNDAEDDGPFLGDIAQRHILGDVVDVDGLSSHGDGGDTRQIDDGEVGTGLCEDVQHDGSIYDLLSLAADLVSHKFYGGSDLVEVGESFLYSFLHHLIELRVGFGQFWYVVHSQFQGSSGDHALS
jgi:hypothetical protein